MSRSHRALATVGSTNLGIRLPLVHSTKTEPWKGAREQTYSRGDWALAVQQGESHLCNSAGSHLSDDDALRISAPILQDHHPPHECH